MRAAKEVVSLRLKRRSNRGPAADASANVRPVHPVQPSTSVTQSETRVVSDETGTSWKVVAVYPTSRSVDRRTLPEKFAQGWLLFQSGDEVRRHAPVPEGWTALSDADLRFLCQNAEVPSRRITTVRPAPTSPAQDA